MIGFDFVYLILFIIQAIGNDEVDANVSVLKG